ncbi:nucleoside diphosphate kinase 6 isoform X2 [Protopterus annectens]|uniref:nucleoside diphosphate kinase 6 isoform X2 n=1 Tax=Protopterus annectens TaxID=7888 RepID=UPI001CF9382C|nr:nucleoside diphosphate kinase 6 isoform X2 [Protopterus annectens]
MEQYISQPGERMTDRGNNLRSGDLPKAWERHLEDGWNQRTVNPFTTVGQGSGVQFSSEAIHQKILENRFIIVRSKDIFWTRKESESFYSEHKGRFFYQRLVEFMCSGPMRAYILAKENAVTHWRSLMGPTKVFRARFTAPESIRGSFGLTDTRNTTHGSGHNCPKRDCPLQSGTGGNPTRNWEKSCS